MARPATSRLKVNPPLGRMPVLQFIPPEELAIDSSYQREIETGPSQTLIRKIAQHWNWDLCQPLVVSRRDGTLYVIDGQHRLQAAKLRRDIQQLPCVVVEYANAADEAASFVHLNQQRRALSKLDVFKAAVASEDPEALAILSALKDAGLSIAPHSNFTTWKPGMVSNIGGIESAWRRHGAAVVRDALRVLGKAFKGQVLRYAGTIFPGIVALRASQGATCELGPLTDLLASREQKDWRSAMMNRRADNPDLRYGAASALAVAEACEELTGKPAGVHVVGMKAKPVLAVPEKTLPAPTPFVFAPDEIGNGPDRDGMVWCDQCDMRVTEGQGTGCKSRYCSLRKGASLKAAA